MKNKVLIELIVPTIEAKYDVYIPINRKIGNIAVLLAKAVNDLSFGEYEENGKNALYNGETGEKYPVDELVINTNIRNSSKIIMM